MPTAQLEHVNFTATDPKATAELLCKLFDWTIRWEGEALNHGYTVHVGAEDNYLAIYAPQGDLTQTGDPHSLRGGLNHIGIVVDDLDTAEARVKEHGFATHNHQDYEPGRRFYFDGPDNVEYEIVCYA